MGNALKRLFRFKNLLGIISIGAICSLVLAYSSPYIHPKTLSFLPLFGLGYIIILSINFCLMLLWLFFNSRWSLAILIVLLLGGKLHFRVLSFGSDETNKTGTELSVLSYNVRLFDVYNLIHADGRVTRNKIFDYVKEQNPDVACFQEFYHKDRPTSFITRDTLVDLLASVDFHERYLFKPKNRQNFGVALFSKYPIIEKGFVAFPEQEKSFNYCIYVDLVKAKDTFRVYNVHLQSIRLKKEEYNIFEDEQQSAKSRSTDALRLLNKIRKAYPIRAEQTEAVIEHIKKSKYPVIVCGDFNDTPLSYCYNQFSAQLTDAFRNTSKGLGTTYAGNLPAGRIDYIFHSPELGSREFNIQSEQLSDHYAVDCKIFVKN